MTSFVTGICGFAGSHLAAHLLDVGETVAGTFLETADQANLGSLRKQIRLLQGDIRDTKRMRSLLRRTKPDIIYHLAAQASAALSFHQPVLTADINVTGTASLLEAMRQECPESRLLFLSSADVYGLVRPRDVPLKETQPPAPRNPYAASKLAGEELCRQHMRSYGLQIVIVRCFNHTGPRQAPGFVVPDFAMQIARLERSRGKREMKVGNLEAQRDISDVRDIVRGHRLLARKGKPGEVYHLASGKVYRIRAVLDMMLQLADVPIAVANDPRRQRPSDLPILAGSIAKTKRATGWRPTIPLTDTLARTLDYWRMYGNQK